MILSKDLANLKTRFRTLIQEDLNLARFRQNKDGDFLFRYERMNLKLVFHDDDPSHVWIAHFGFRWVKGDDATLARADRCISEVNHRVKCVKLDRRPDADNEGDHPVSASISFLVDDVTSQDPDTFERYLALIKTGTNMFCELFELPENMPPSEPDAAVMRH
jgi:hypothetical protein